MRRKNNLKLQQHISDLENTVLINQECINNMLPITQLKQDEKNKLSLILSKLSKYFNEKKNYKKKISEINSKMLINKQIIEEIKRRRDEGYLMYKDQITNLSESITKKTSLVKQFQKKFSEVEIFIQRECQTEEHIEKYGKWKTFTIIPFMKKNSDNTTNNNINIINENNDNNVELNKIKEYYDKVINIDKKEIELMKCRLNIISDINFKKQIIPTFKSKNPISNLDVNINLFDPK